MTCQQVKEAMPLYYYGELPPEQEENVEAHCARCVPCGREVESYRRLAGALDEAALEPSLGLLSDCRELLARRVTEWERPSPAAAWWSRLSSWSFDFRMPAAAMALVALGWFSAKVVPSNGVQQVPMTSLVRSVEPRVSGGVQIAVDDVHRRIVSGGVEDRQIRSLLLAAAREESSPGVRVESVQVLTTMAASADIRSALLDAVQHDPNPGVRLKALEGLKQFGQDREVRRAMTEVLLNDSNPGIRIKVIDLLAAHHDDSMVSVMQNLVRKESDGYVRGRLQRALLSMNASPGIF